LTKTEKRAAHKLAARWGISLSELMRRQLNDAISQDHSAPWMRFAGMIQSGSFRSSREIDAVVYSEQ
jgi:hypothetical protein